VTQITKLDTNPHIEAAAIALLAVNLKHQDVTDEYGDEASQVIDGCYSLMGLQSRDGLTAKQQGRLDAVMEMIQGKALKMERVLRSARLVSKRD